MTYKDSFYLKHIVEAINDIQEYLKKITYKRFLKEKMIQDAVIRKFEVIGEASNKLSKEFKRKNGKIPWRDIIDMRNKISHEYFGIDYKVIWDTYENDLDILKQQVQEAANNQTD